MAERVGFEPTNTVRCYTLSRRAPSTARPPLHKPQSAPTAGRDCSRRTPLVLRFAPDRCSFAATSKIAPAILSNPRTRLGVTHFPGVRLRPLGHLSTRPQGYRRRPTRSNGARTPRKPARTGGPWVSAPGARGGAPARLAAGRLIGRRRLVARRNVEARVLGPRGRRRKLHGGNDQGALSIRSIQPWRYFQRWYLAGSLIFLPSVAIRATKQVTAAHQRCRSNNHQNSIQTHAAWSSRLIPAACMARSTVSWCVADSSTNGNRIAFPMRPILATAHLTGIGLASTNKSLCKGCKLASIARALTKSPARAA